MGVRCNLKKSALKQNPKTKQQQKKIWRVCHLLQNNVAYSQIKVIQHSSWSNTRKRHIAVRELPLANEMVTTHQLELDIAHASVPTLV